jgi:hypothetical protein
MLLHHGSLMLAERRRGHGHGRVVLFLVQYHIVSPLLVAVAVVWYCSAWCSMQHAGDCGSFCCGGVVWCLCVDVDVDVDHHSITVWRDDGKAIHAVLVLVLGKVVSSVALRLLGLLLCYYCYNSGSVGRTVCICIIIDDGCGCGCQYIQYYQSGLR